MSEHKLVHKVNKMIPFEVNMLNDPIVIASSTGTITDINNSFTAKFKWTKEELVGQNVHLLIPSKFIRKSKHDAMLKNYNINNYSPIIGKSRIVPVCTPDDAEILVKIKMIPLQRKKGMCFMAFFDKIDFTRRFVDFEVDYQSLHLKFMNVAPTEEFKESDMLIGSNLIVKDIARIFAKELQVLGDFIIENCASPSIAKMCKHFLVNTPIGKLGVLLKEMDRVFDNNHLSYLNVTCLHIVFPSLASKLDVEFLESLKPSLYEDTTESS